MSNCKPLFNADVITHPCPGLGNLFLSKGVPGGNVHTIPDSKVHGANMGPIWGQQVPGGPHVCPVNFAIWDMYPIASIRALDFNYRLGGCVIGWDVPLTNFSLDTSHKIMYNLNQGELKNTLLPDCEKIAIYCAYCNLNVSVGTSGVLCVF